MDVVNDKRRPEPPDKGKDVVEHQNPPSDDNMDDDNIFRGFTENEMTDDITDKSYQNRKRRDEKDYTANEKKRTKPSTSYTRTQIKSNNTNTNTQAQSSGNSLTSPSSSQFTHSLITPKQDSHTQSFASKFTTTLTQDKPGTSTTTNNIQIRNYSYNVIFIEPISIKEDQTLLEPMEVGKFLHDLNLDQFCELKRAGQYRYKLIYKIPQDTEKILNATSLLRNNNYKAYIPKMLTETTGVIKDIPTSFTDSEIRMNAVCNKKIINVERIKRIRDSELVNTRSVKVTVEGPELPRVIQIYGVFCKPEIYIYPVRICNKCWRIGHKAAACKSKETCLRCGKYITEEHKGCDEGTPIKCKNCGNKHLPTDKNCPERKRREHINAAMMLNKMTFMEAAELYPNTQNRFSLLESTEEFPNLEAPIRVNNGFRPEVQKRNIKDYSKVIEGLLKPKQKPNIIKNTFPQVELVPEQVNVITNNPHAVSETEKFQTMSNHLRSFFSTLLKNKEELTDSDPSKDLLLIEIGAMIKNIIDKIENLNVSKN